MPGCWSISACSLPPRSLMREKRNLLAGTATAWAIAPSVLIGLIAVTGLGRYAARAATTRVESTSASVHNAAANDVSCFDTSPHKTLFVRVEPDVQLEV